MKKQVLLGIVVICHLFICFNLQAQSNISYGIKGGINVSNSSHDNMGSRLGYHVGLIADKQYSNNFYLRSGIEFTTKGAKGEQRWIISDVEDVRSWKYRLNYLQIPILIGYKYALNNSTNLSVNVGPHFSYGIYAREKYTYTVLDSPVPFEQAYVENQYKGFDEVGLQKFDMGITGGLGVEYKQYFLNINYEAGLLNLMSGYDGGNPSWKNQNFTVSVGYFFKK